MDAITTKDGKHHMVGNDTDFMELLREYLGNEAADWYCNREMGNTKLKEEISEIIDPVHEGLIKELPSGTKVLDFNRLTNVLGTDNLCLIAAIAMDIRGWDE